MPNWFPLMMKRPDSSMLVQDQISRWRERSHVTLEQWMPTEHTAPERLHEAMRYCVFNGGKRIRPVLSYAAGYALNIAPTLVDPSAAAIELVHAYSLVHDDLPAMDDDDLRRGKPTCHKAYDEATAVLVGDALQTLAFHVLAHGLHNDIPATQRLEIINTLAIASGSRGMAGGQAIDLAAVGKNLNIAELENMHIHKTGALIRASVKMAALCKPDVDKTILKKLDHYAKCIGLAFQIQDDILDIESDTETLGKPQGSDAAQDKPTYPALLGMDQARAMAQELYDDALESLSPFADRGEPLRWLADYIIQRQQ